MFFKKKCHCNQHDDLIKLQELNKELKEYENKLNEIDKMPKIYFPSEAGLYRMVESYEKCADYIALCLQCGYEEEFVHKLKSYATAPQYELDYLKNLGKFLINYGERTEEYQKIKNKIEEIKNEKKKLKEKLGIE